jgi:hypothetical protein
LTRPLAVRTTTPGSAPTADRADRVADRAPDLGGAVAKHGVDTGEWTRWLIGRTRPARRKRRQVPEAM